MSVSDMYESDYARRMAREVPAVNQLRLVSEARVLAGVPSGLSPLHARLLWEDTMIRRIGYPLEARDSRDLITASREAMETRRTLRDLKLFNRYGGGGAILN